MESTLKKLIEEEILMHYTYEPQSPYGQCAALLMERETALMQTLDEKQTELLVALEDAHAGCLDLVQEERFIEGFLKGAQLMQELFITPPQTSFSMQAADNTNNNGNRNKKI